MVRVVVSLLPMKYNRAAGYIKERLTTSVYAIITIDRALEHTPSRLLTDQITFMIKKIKKNPHNYMY